MKDKLVKYNHKAIYYRAKKTLIALSFVFGAAIAFTIPVSISLAVQESPKAVEEKPSEEDEENTSENQIEAYKIIL